MSKVSENLQNLGISRSQLVRRSGLTPEKIELLYAGDPASLSDLKAISSGLRIPIHILVSGKKSATDDELSILFRDTRKSHDEFDVTVERVATFVEAALDLLPQRDAIPAWIDEISVPEETYIGAAHSASKFRRRFYAHQQHAPAIDLPQMLGAAEGIILGRLNFSRYEGVSLIAGNYCFIFVSPRFDGRMLFTTGHELGHVIAHHPKLKTPIFEMPEEIGSFNRSSKSEAFVDAFSSNLLLPDQGVGRALQIIREQFDLTSDQIGDIEILFIARFFGVSFEVAARRCEDLELIPKGSSNSLTKFIKDNFGSPEKRASDLKMPDRQKIYIPPVSNILAKAITNAISAGDISIGWAADRFGLSIGEILASNIKERSL